MGSGGWVGSVGSAGVGQGGHQDRPGGVEVGVAPAKIAVPKLSPWHVSRPRLISLLDATDDRQVVLVSAPAGYGKTLLLAEWVASAHGRTAWVAVDDDDNDARRFWSAVLAALCSCTSVPARNALRTMAPPDTSEQLPTFVASIVEALSLLPEPIRLVLDDLHELTDADTLHGLAALVRDRPAELRLVLAARADPSLPLGRPRLAGQLCEVRAPELAFSAEEAVALFARAEMPVDKERVRALLEQTEGWAAGLWLAARSMREAEDPDLFVGDLAGSGRAISEYLIGEVLSGISPEVLEVLRAVSVCDQPTARLAVAVSGRLEAGELLAALEDETSLVISFGAGRRRFRVHPLLRAHLIADMRRRRPDLVAMLHRRAALWFARREEPVAGLWHARMAEDAGLVAALLRRHGVALLMAGRHGLAREALAATAPAMVEADPGLALVAAFAHLEVGRLGAVDHYLDRAAASWPDEPDTELVGLDGLVRIQRAWYGDVPGPPRATGSAVRASGGTVAIRGAGPGVDGEAGSDLLGLILHANAELVAGRVGTAAALAEQAADRAIQEGNPYQGARSTALLGVVAALRGDVRRMLALADRAQELAPVEAWRNSVGEGLTVALRAYGALLRARPEESLRLVASVAGAEAEPTEAMGAEAGGSLPVLEMVRAAARFDLGEHVPALETLRSGRQRIPRGRALGVTAAFAALVEHGAATRLGHATHAQAVLDWAEQRLDPCGDVMFLRACAPARISRYRAAREHLRPLLDGSAPPLVRWSLIEGWLLQCWIELRTGDRQRADDALKHALSLSEEMGVLRPLAGARPEIIELLTQQFGGLGRLESCAHEVLAIRRTPNGWPVLTPLTKRERAVLRLLPTFRSLEEIGADLDVSVNTVKTHVRGIYAKLAVTSRRDAVAVARQRGLLDPEPAAPADLAAWRSLRAVPG
jgi:LuxR family transcriptional regulator, maltose regulon positive regulatory protein